MTNQEKELIDKVYKRFQTTMIGAIARFENVFGHLWEQESRQGDEFADMWEYARNSILNNGNKQARAAIDDIGAFLNNNSNKYQLNNKYSYKFNFDNNIQGDKYED
jgi:hypothetical protein